jgi:hypothetical protein
MGTLTGGADFVSASLSARLYSLGLYQGMSLDIPLMADS